MNLHEYQAKESLSSFGVPTPPFFVASSIEEVEKGLNRHQMEQGVVKIQVHAGGRGKAGGVKMAKNRQEILQAAKQLIGFKLVNHQTGPQGVIAEKVLVTAPIAIEKEFYLAILVDRQRKKAVVIASPEGGMEIEEIAKNTPEKILTLPLYDDGRWRGFQALKLAAFMGWKKEVADQGKDLVESLVKAFFDMDASLVEINPLVLTKEGVLTALDAKISIDDNALYRQEALKGAEDLKQLPEAERRAREADLAYVALGGNIGCMVNGAGLAMATMDMIQLYGGKPANFLDVGGSATEEKIAEGFRLLLLDPDVKAILINIFGGIMSCETIAGGVIAALTAFELPVPLVVRMEGTHVEQGKKMLRESGLKLTVASNFEEAAEKAVAASKGVR